MRYFLYVGLKGFYARAWDGRVEGPVAVHRDKRVIDLNSDARALGLKVGMGQDEAKVLLQGSGLIAFEEEPYREAQQRWLDVLATFSSVVEPDEMHSAWADLSGHPAIFEVVKEIRRSFSIFDFGFWIGLAQTKWLAKQSAEILGDAEETLWEEAAREVLENPAEFLSPLPVSVLSPIDSKHIERLKFLGYRISCDVAGLPLRTLKAQFGEAALKIHACAKGGWQEPVRALYPPDALVAKASFPGGIENLEELNAALEKLAARLAKLLSDRESQGYRIEASLEFEEGVCCRQRTFSRPIRTGRQAFSALASVVGAPTQPVHSILVRMPGLQKAKERQSDLFIARAADEDSAVERTLGSLRGVFGDKSVMRASEKVEPRRVKVLRAWSHATGWK